MDVEFGGDFNSNNSMPGPMPNDFSNGNNTPESMPIDNSNADEALDNNDDIDSLESEDPKKYIQQLCGKLSQSLRTYNNDQDKPDTELNKYVAGMVIPQATKSMTDKDKNEVIGKIKKGITDDSEDDDVESNEELKEEGFNHINETFGNDSDVRHTKRFDKKSKVNFKNPFISNR